MTIEGVRDEFIVGRKGKIKNKNNKKKLIWGQIGFVKIKGVGRDSDRQRR